MSATNDDFYIGWQERAPARTAGFVTRRVAVLLVLSALVAAAITVTQAPFAASRFEFGTTRPLEGRIERIPYPTLVVDRPATEGGVSRWLLTVFGKSGAEAQVGDLDGHRVRLKGTLVHRDNVTMVEIVDGSVEDLGKVTSTPSPPSPDDGDVVTLFGEIVDSKCYLGVMKPGNLKSHRACAARCISGGVPPVLLTRDAEGRASYHLLVDEDGGVVNQRVLDMVAEPIEVTGRLVQRDGLAVLYADPATYVRVP